jgi:predicted oxidoreductase
MGGLAKESFGGIWFAGTPLQKRYGIRDGAQQGLRDWHAFAEFGPDDHWPRAWAEAYVQRANEEIFDWLRGLGVQFMPMPLWVERGLHTPGNSVPRWHIVWGTGHELQVVLNEHLLARPNRELLEMRPRWARVSAGEAACAAQAVPHRSHLCGDGGIVFRKRRKGRRGDQQGKGEEADHGSDGSGGNGRRKARSSGRKNRATMGW